MIFKDERTIILFIYFFQLEKIITDNISLVNEPPYKMAKPASLSVPWVPEGFFFLACGWMLRCRPQVDRSSVEGRSTFGHEGHNLKSCLKPETAHQKSQAPKVENAIKM